MISDVIDGDGAYWIAMEELEKWYKGDNRSIAAQEREREVMLFSWMRSERDT